MRGTTRVARMTEVWEGKRYSEADSTAVTRVRCGKCGLWYGEELAAAIGKIRHNRVFLCINCDPAANGPAWVRVL